MSKCPRGNKKPRGRDADLIVTKPRPRMNYEWI